LFKEKLLLSWIAPRGVIAGSVASLFGLKLTTLGHPDAVFLETFTFSIILITIIFQGGSAGKIVKWLKLEEPEKKGWLIVGGHLFARKVAQFIEKTGKGNCTILDTNADAIQEAKQDGLVAFQGNALSLKSLPTEITSSIGYVVALTDNRDLNQLICEKWHGLVENQKLFRWSSDAQEIELQIAGGGIPIWQNLTKPSQVSYDIKKREKTLQHLHHQIGNSIDSSSKVLMMKNQGKISFDRPSEVPEGVELLLMKSIPGLWSGLLPREHILFIQPDSYQNAIEIVFEKIRSLYPDLEYQGLLSELLTRELAFPTTLAYGVAAPHLHYPTLTEPICFLARISGDIQLKTYDGEPVKLLFLLLSQESEPDLHLRILSEFASLVSTPAKVHSLVRAATVDDFIQLIIEKKTDVPLSLE